ncbi:hypothetical protein [Actinacidiphila rubida]|uniref:Uncharacterized protein n=1 Tax=Actinacidiphila rubida TaxID=310780 RepID=A0A1H8SWX5_9ACTN|nr:hypothetical protein [Actinacidiphila rubida]SEO83035.1 hypothetical protein SAMN05216267_104621 [Actinacidiphila rubida]
MSGRRVADAWLRIVAEPLPAAYYACQICPYTASVKGRGKRDIAKVATFAASIRNDHRATCPTLHPERTRAA